MQFKVERFIELYEIPILIIVLLAFIFVNIQGLSWGLPARWNPDELVGVVNLVLRGQATIDQTNFDYPSLPKYFMLFFGYITQALGKSTYAFFMVARFCSVLLGGLTAWVAYASVRQISSKKWPALFAALLIATNNELAANVHFAHNDLYVIFFSAFVIYISLKYVKILDKKWLYLAFFAAGLTSSSKYNGGGIIFIPFIAYFLVEKKSLYKKWFAVIKTYTVGAMLVIFGYAVGTPTFLVSFNHYVNGLLPALWRHANFNRTPLSKPGIIMQWDMMIQVFGLAFFILFLIAISTIIYLLIRNKFSVGDRTHFSQKGLFIILFSLFILDLPILVSYNVQPRFFLPLLVPISITIAVFIEYLIARLRHQKYDQFILPVMILSSVLIIYSGFRVTGTILNIVNDARYEASAYIAQLPNDKSIELTNYSPNVSENQFESCREYPLLILKFDSQTLPSAFQGEYNLGEKGIETRKPDYFVLSSFVYDKFEDPYVCKRHQADCDFFNNLFAEKTNYKLQMTFSSKLPWYIPKVENYFINPDIYFFIRDEK